MGGDDLGLVRPVNNMFKWHASCTRSISEMAVMTVYALPQHLSCVTNLSGQ